MEAKPVSSPTASAHNLSLFDGDAFNDATLYQCVVKALQYVLITHLISHLQSTKSFISCSLLLQDLA
jgi:hypothetical protein